MSIYNLLANHPLFQKANKKSLEVLANKSGRRTINKGEYLIYQGAMEEHCYLILSGKLIVFHQDDDNDKYFLGELSINEIIGEIPLFSKMPWHINLYAQRESEVIVFSKNALIQFLQHCPDVMVNFIDSMSNKFLQFTKHKNKSLHPKTISIGSTHNSSEHQNFLSEYIKLLRKDYHILFLSSSFYKERWQEAIKQKNTSFIKQFIEEQEKIYDKIIIEIDPSSSFLCKTLLNNSDSFFFVIHNNMTPSLGPFSYLLTEKHHPFSHFFKFIFLHPNSSLQKEMISAWLSTYPKFSHLNIRINNHFDMIRFMRLSLKKDVGIILGNGGARTFSHIGVLQALEEHDIIIDKIAGSGLGGIISALYAMEYDAKKIKDLFKQVFKDIDRYMDYTLPVRSLIKGEKIQSLLNEIFEDRKIEQLILSFFCISTSLDSIKPIIHTKGNISSALLSSISIPGIFPPVYEKKNFLVDGGLINPLPIDLMHQLYPSCQIIGVDVETKNYPSYPTSFPSIVSGWLELCKFFLPFIKNRKIPTIFHTLLLSASTHCSNHKEQIHKHNLANIILSPPLKEVGVLDFDKIDKIIEDGYRYTIDNISSIKKSFFCN